MRFPLARPLRLAIIFLLLLVSFSPSAGEWDVDTLGTDADWWTGFIPSGFYGDCGNGLEDDITDLVTYGDLLIVAGRFAWANGIEARGLVSWDGTTWNSLYPPGELGGPACFAVHDGKLVVGGTEPTIWTWDGDLWEEIDEGVIPDSFKVCEMETLGGDLWVLAADTTGSTRIATRMFTRRDGAWETAGTDTLRGLRPVVRDMIHHDGDLFIAGDFYFPRGPEGCYDVARWGSFGWEGLGGGLETWGQAYTLASFDGALVVGGRFDEAGGAYALDVAAWDGSDWRPVGEGLGYAEGARAAVNDLTVLGGRLYALGEFTHSGDRAVRIVGAWDGSEWSPVGDFSQRSYRSSWMKSLSAWKGIVVLAGAFSFGERGYVPDLLGWNTNLFGWKGWRPVGSEETELTSPVYDFAVTEDGLVATAQFSVADRSEAEYGVGLWDGAEWTRIGGAFDNRVSTVTASGEGLYAGGYFRSAGGRSANFIARWDGSEWGPMGGGMNNPVFDIAVWNGKVIAAGWFSEADGKEVWFIASWNGEEWDRMGHGTHGLDGAAPVDLEIYDGDFYACGRFSIAGNDRADGMARWNGDEWFGMRGGNVTYDEYYPDMYDMEPWNGMVAVAGEFETAGGEPSPHIALWDGADWRAVPSPEGVGVELLGTHGGRLVTAGAFDFAGDGSPDFENFVYQWDGRSWFSMGSGIGYAPVAGKRASRIHAMAEWRGSLFVSGWFERAGGRPAFGIARWDGQSYSLPAPSLHLALGPNPALSRVTLQWFQDDPGPVDIRVFDIRGRRTASLVTETWPGGYHAYEWSLKDDDGRDVAPGVYFVRLETERGSAVRRVVVVR